MDEESSTITLAAIAGEALSNGKNGIHGLDSVDDMHLDQDLNDESHGLSEQYVAGSLTDPEEHNIQAFAKLEFDDGEFYMNTYAVELGRDVQAARQAFAKDLQAREGTVSGSKKRSASNDDGSVRLEEIRHDEDQNMGENLVSESGGVIANHHGTPLKKKGRRKSSKSSASSSQHLSPTGSVPFSKTNYNALAMESLMGHSEMNGFRSSDQMPPPELIPLIPIHPPKVLRNSPTGHKSISRRHIKIAFNFEKHLFEVEIIGRNGGFVDEVFYHQGDIQPLTNGSVIQIGGVGIRFVLPDVPPGETGAEIGLGSDLLSGGQTSFDVENSSEQDNDGDEDREINGEDDAIRVKHEVDDEPEVAQTRAKAKRKPEPPPAPPKRKGPGRPPKNGIISKREQALLARQAREADKAAGQNNSGSLPARDKTKASKDTKETTQEEPSLQPNGKRKYTKRKRAGGLEDPQKVRESTEQTESVPPEQSKAAVLPPKPLKEKKPAKPPRSPSPVFNEAEMTPEQLAKPQHSYVVLIHEALSNSKTGQMSLPQIYRAIERAYPYYKLRVQTQGWQSSVRHNLSQHPAFRKIERDGKGWMWGLVPEVSIEKEKKRRATPPPISQQQYYSQGPSPMTRPPYSYPVMPPNGLPQPPYGYHPGMQPGRMPHPPPPFGRPGFPLPLINPQSETTYQSPYGSTPPPAAEKQSSNSQHLANSNGTQGDVVTSPIQPSQNQPINSHDQPNDATHGSCDGPQHSRASPPPLASSIIHHDNLDIMSFIDKFKAELIANVEDKAEAEALVKSAIRRTIHSQSNVSDPINDISPPEKAITTALQKILNRPSEKSTSETTHQTPNSPEQTSSTDPKTIAISLAAEKAAKIALQSNTPPTSEPADQKTEPVIQASGSPKRPLENGDGGGKTAEDEAGQPVAKKIAPG